MAKRQPKDLDFNEYTKFLAWCAEGKELGARFSTAWPLWLKLAAQRKLKNKFETFNISKIRFSLELGHPCVVATVQESEGRVGVAILTKVVMEELGAA